MPNCLFSPSSSYTFVQFSDVTSFSCFLDNCSFAGHFCSWINDNGDDFDWLLNSGQTMTQETGPSTDADGDGNEKADCFFRENVISVGETLIS